MLSCKSLSKQALTLVFITFFALMTFASPALSFESPDDGSNDRFVDDILNDSDEEDEPLQGEQEGTDEDISSDSDTPKEHEPDEEDGTPVASGSQNLFLLSLQMFAALGVVIFLIYTVLRMIHKRSQSFQDHSTLQNIGGVNLGTNRSVQLVRVGDRLLIVGVGDTIQLLREVDDPEEIEKLLQDQKASDVFDQPVSKMSKWLKSNIFQRSKANSSEPTSHFGQLLDQELKDVSDEHRKAHSTVEEKER
ncbi:flagellar biosynthetic protein FliO [Texcoconibacillus texcoconensis]|uniref:Flagellar protein FliO/FliZ n=1 Tax=Texcoconibacillus texcoconensis TaxID=1095777 RepID=A0A840QIW5_9BACI|nr:flagellar biosynthetic protein FliO [Texcoconibacillus texcoconensis]MBB5172065.1 flagellar protein FliO/FliZ [Texcoconibacillus texcoconensis]